MSYVMLTLGLLLAAALLAGGLGQMLRLPRVTSFLLIGVALGPWIPAEHIEHLKPLTKLAIALVLFNLGCHFPLARVRRIMRRVLRLSLGELCTTFLLVTVGLTLLGWAVGGIGPEAALLLGALALATAPATTILVLKETESEGPITEYIQAMVAVNNLISIVLFEVLFVAVYFLQDKLGTSATTQLVELGRGMAGSVALGIIGGLVVSFSFALIGEGRRLVLLVAVIALLLGICLARPELPYLLTFLAMGVTVANTSHDSRQMLAELDRLTGLLCVVFFVTHGAELDLGALKQAGLIGVGYIVLRFCGKYFGVMLAGGTWHEKPEVRRWLGAALMSQAGAAIALSAIAAGRDEVLGTQLQNIILGTVVVFEIVGPLLARQAVLRAGEVPLAHAIHHSGFGLADQLQVVWNRLLVAVGRDPWAKRSTADLTVKELMRKNVNGVPQAATFDELVVHLEHTRDNTIPVVDESGCLVGVIRYRELSHALFDPTLNLLVRVADVTTPAGRALRPDEPITRANSIFAASKDDCIPVVADDPPERLLGVVRRRDMLRLLIRGRGDAPDA